METSVIVIDRIGNVGFGKGMLRIECIAVNGVGEGEAVRDAA